MVIKPAVGREQPRPSQVAHEADSSSSKYSGEVASEANGDDESTHVIVRQERSDDLTHQTDGPLAQQQIQALASSLCSGKKGVERKKEQIAAGYMLDRPAGQALSSRE